MNFQPTQAQAMFLAIIGELPSSAATPWSAATEQMYLIGLRSIPDAGLPKLCEAVLDVCRFRPTVHEVKDIWQRLTAEGDAVTPADVVASLSERVQRFGAYACPHPVLRHTYILGPPPDLSPHEKGVVACWGGWENYANDDSPLGVKRGQALKVAEMVIRGEQGDGLRQLRLEYREQQAALDSQRALDSPAEPASLPAPEPRDGGMARLGSLGIRGMK